MLKPVLLVNKQPQLYHADVMKAKTFLPRPVDLIVTSPPYNIHGGSGENWRQGVDYDCHDDSMDESLYQEWQIMILDALWEITKTGGSLFYNHKIRHRSNESFHPIKWIGETLWKFRQEIIWDRGSTHNHNPFYFWPEDERIYWLTKGNPNLDRPIGMSTIWRFPFKPSTWHPAPFPTDLPRRVIGAVGKDGDLVYDPFCGSGSTLEAACEYGLDSIGSDISLEYLRLACREKGWIPDIKSID